MKVQSRIFLVVCFAFSFFIVAELPAKAQQPAESTSRSESLVYSLKGPDLFRAYCVSCHGLSGKGDGPGAPALKAKVPDLTLLANRHGGQFPSALVREFIAGDKVAPSHGSREMPIWGPIFHRVEEDRDFGNVRLENLVTYLASIQSAGPSTPPSGAGLYKQHCAVCHGEDLKGGSPVPYPYRTPPDLTTLARRHGGEFPQRYVSDVLREGIILPAHGPAEMPVWGMDFRLGEKLDEAQVSSRVTELANYIKSLQAK